LPALAASTQFGLLLFAPLLFYLFGSFATAPVKDLIGRLGFAPPSPETAVGIASYLGNVKADDHSLPQRSSA